MFYEAARRLVVITRSLLMTQLQVSLVIVAPGGSLKVVVQEGGVRAVVDVSSSVLSI